MFHIYVIRECNLKWDQCTAHLLEWPKSETLTIPNAGENLEAMGALIQLRMVGMQNGTVFGRQKGDLL